MIGYACSNITLQERDGTTPARSCRIATLLKQKNPISYCIELARENLLDTIKILKWNVENNIFMYRLSASMFPFATHKDFAWELDELMDEIKEIGRIVKAYDMRVSSHLPQFINLGSPDKEVVKKSIKDLEFQSDFFDRMEFGPKHRLIIHAGGVYEDRNSTEKRFAKVYNSLDKSIKDRLTIENDEKSWTVKQLIKLHDMTDMTVLIDYLHWQINHEPGSEREEDLNLALSTWKVKPKIHYSEQAPDKGTGAHSFLIKNIIVSEEFDTMVEAKGKELAILPFIKKLCKA